MRERWRPAAALDADDGVPDADASARGLAPAPAPGDRRQGAPAAVLHWSRWRVRRLVAVVGASAAGQGASGADAGSRDEMSLSDDGWLD